ncbi:hypothetical protein JCM8097_009342 [Rhodosporidiobolus ruineniae]
MSGAEARVLILYTGGTIGMLRTEAGGYAPHPGFLASWFHDPTGESVWTNSSSVAAFSSWASRAGSGSTTPASPASLANEHDSSNLVVHTAAGDISLPSLVTPRFAQGKRIRYAIYEYESLIDSSEIEPADFLRIAADIERNYAAYDGFIILHGTDTMAYSASSLSFLLEDLGKTVILSGSQIPASGVFTDAIDNVLGSLILAGHFVIPEVCLFFDNHLYRGNRAIKASTESFHAFSSPNLPPLATVGIDVDVDWSRVLRPGPRPFRAHKSFSSDVATLRIFPGITSQAVRAFLRPGGGLRGVVIESYGAGNAPRRAELLKAFKEASDQGIVIVNVTQCVTGSVAPDIYETGRALAAVGVVGGGDMTTEAALAKLSYLLSKGLNPDQVRKLLVQPLRGELTPVSTVPTFSSPPDTESRLKSLFSQVVELAPRHGSVASPTHAPVGLPDLSYSSVPAEFSRPWPPTLGDEQDLRAAITPYLLAQAASRADGLLPSLLASLDSPAAETASTSSSSAPLSLPSILNESATSTLQAPLHLAIIASLPQNVDTLLAAGASVHVRDVFGHSPLFYAAKGGGEHGLAMVKSLRAAGGHLSEQEIEGGQVGLEVIKAERGAEAEMALQVWAEAAGEEGLERAKAALKAMLSVE